MSMSSGGETKTTTSAPWTEQQPYLKAGYEGASDLLAKQGTPTYYPGQTYAGLSGETGSALGNTWKYSTDAMTNRGGANYAANQFATGGLGDWGNVDTLRNLGANNNTGPVTNNLGNMAAGNEYALNPAYSTYAGLMSGGGTKMAQNLYDRTSDIIANGGGVADATRAGIGDITATGGGSNSQIRSDINDLITGQAQGANPGFSQLGATASGAYLNSNPYLDDTYRRAADKVARTYQTSTAPTIDMDMAAGGRYGSGLHASRQAAATGDLGETLNNLATGIYGNNYAQERQNQLTAANTLGNQYLQGQGLRATTASAAADQASRDAALRLQAQGQISGDMSGDLSRRLAASNAMTGVEQGDWSNLMNGLDKMSSIYDSGANRQLQANQLVNSAYQSGADRQLNATTAAGNAYLQNRAQQLQGLNLLPQMQDMDYRDLQAQLGVGSTYDADRQAQITDAMTRYNFNQNAPWQQLGQYMTLVGGGSPGAVTSTSTSGGSALGGLGGILSGLGGLGQFAAGTRGLLWG